MVSLNPLFSGSQISSTPERSMAKQINSAREVRSDKKDDYKFPVTIEMLDVLTRRVRDLNRRSRQVTHMTEYNSKLLALGLQKDPSYFEPVEYADTKKYKHAKLSQFHSDKLFELTILWGGCSRREAVYRIMYNLVQKGDLL